MRTYIPVSYALADSIDSLQKDSVRTDDSWTLIFHIFDVSAFSVSFFHDDGDDGVAVIPVDSDSVLDYNCKREYSHSAVTYHWPVQLPIHSVNFYFEQLIDCFADCQSHVDCRNGTSDRYFSPNDWKSNFWFAS